MLFCHFFHSTFYTNKKNQVYRNANVFVNLLYHFSALLCAWILTRTLSLSTKEPWGPSTTENERLVFFFLNCFFYFGIFLLHEKGWDMRWKLIIKKCFILSIIKRNCWWHFANLRLLIEQINFFKYSTIRKYVFMATRD